MLSAKFPNAAGGLTGWKGTDCTMPICVQGYFDPYCTNLPQAPGGEGCFRCANGGNCTRGRAEITSRWPLRNIHVAAAAPPRPAGASLEKKNAISAVAGLHGVSTSRPRRRRCLHGISTSWPRRRRDPSELLLRKILSRHPRNILAGTAPDTCSCAPGWTGYDCRTPVCEVVATPLQRRQLDTFDEEKVDLFEKSPCGLVGIYPLTPVPYTYEGPVGEPGGYYASRGNCSMPNECACLRVGRADYDLRDDSSPRTIRVSAAASPRLVVSAEYPRPCRGLVSAEYPRPRRGLVSADYPRPRHELVSADYPRPRRGVAATRRLRGISASPPRRRRDSSPRNIHVPDASSSPRTIRVPAAAASRPTAKT